MNKKTKDILVSAVALAIIGGVTTAALAGTNQLTAGVIAERTAAAEDAARRQVIEADSFDRMTLTVDGEEVVYYVAAAADGETVGYVFTATATGKSSGMVVMTGIRTDGTIAGVAITSDNETAGYVDKVRDAGLLTRFAGQTAKTFVLGEDVDGVSQATKTSRGVFSGVNQATAWFAAITKGGEGA